METRRYHIAKSGAVDIAFSDDDVFAAYDALATEAIAECRTSLAMAARFLGAALWRLPFEPAPLVRPLAVGCGLVRYDPERVVDRYGLGDGELVRDCLHAVLHCVLHHPFDTRHDEFDAWSLACDMAVESCALQLCADRFPSEGDGDRAAALEKLQRVAGSTTAPALYQVLRRGQAGELLYETHGLTGSDIVWLRDLFTRDSHDLWAGNREGEPDGPARGASAPLPDLQARGEAGGDGDARSAVAAAEAGEATGRDDDEAAADANHCVPPEDDRAEGAPGSAEPHGATGESAAGESNGALEGASPSAGDLAREAALEEWRRISKQVEAGLRAQLAGTAGGGLLQNLAVANRRAVDYDAFLRRFSTVAEDLRVNDEEFDYVFYTYGLARYGDMPLVEPLEYAERSRVREFVVAIDTSGSCSGRLVRAFVERTYALLSKESSFGDQVNVHIVQCDREVRSATKVTSIGQLRDYADSFWVSGGGGTDFRPVFDYVDSQVRQGEFEDLRGLVYFTDGYGTFPARPPDYQVAFVFVDAEGIDVRVPPWAMKAVMTHDEIEVRPAR